MKKFALLAMAIVVMMAVATYNTGTASAASVGSKEVCRTSVITKEVKSFIFRSVLVRMSMRTSWCFNGQRVTRANVICKVEKIDRATISIDRCQSQFSFESWRGRPNGSVYTLATVNFSNCIIVKSIGCIQSAVLNIEARYRGDGTEEES